jgi:rare lipoprotein A (peptidoglycan hydrolase)
MRRFAIALASLFATSPAFANTVTATVYHPDFHGGPNYCDGTPYQHWGLSAASSWLPCHSKVRIHHRGRVLTVYVKDRCAGCDLDLSAGAAYRLGVPLDGVADVQISY